METRTFNIPSENKPLVEARIEKLNKRASKLSLPEITLTWGKAYLESRIIKGKPKDVLVIPVDLTGPFNVRYNDYQFMATLQHLPSGENIIRAIADSNWIVPVEYHNSGSQCEHCQVNRYRKDTYLVVRDTDGKTFQVGSSCVKDFIGNNSPDDLLKKANLIAEMISFMKGSCSGGGSNNDECFHITNFLSHTAAVIRKHGWVSKKTAGINNTVPTVVRVMSNIDDASFGETLSCPILEEDREKAKSVSEWAENLSDEECEANDYIHNLRAISRSGMVGLRTVGFAASMVGTYDREFNKHNPKKISTHVGIIGLREEFELIFKNKQSGSSDYGSYNRFIFNDSNENVMVWTTSSSPDFEVNKKYRIMGTIKKHETYKNVEQTIISNCKVTAYYD